MEIVTLPPELPAVRAYASRGAAAFPVAEGAGDAHVYVVTFAPGGEIGPHPAGFGQLFWVVHGRGWVSGEDGVRVAVAAGQGALIRRGERHAKGSDSGMTALMVQVSDLARAPEGS